MNHNTMNHIIIIFDQFIRLGGKFKLDGNIEMQVKVTVSSITLVEIQITNSHGHIFLHWGGMRKRKEKWVLPSHCPKGTKVLNDQALRTPFVKSGLDSFLKVEIDDPAIEAIEFLILDERQNRSYVVIFLRSNAPSANGSLHTLADRDSGSGVSDDAQKEKIKIFCSTDGIILPRREMGN
ncbi:hypothetical protein Tco_0300186 [Tanacetum coccineum]